MITKETLIGDVLEMRSDAGEILFGAGLCCVGCPMSQQETIEQGCLAHDLSKKEIDELIKRLNK